MTTTIISDIPVPIKVFCSQHAWPSESAVRAYRMRSHELGLTSAFLTVSRRVLIRPKTFFELLNNANEVKASEKKAYEEKQKYSSKKS